MVVFASAKLLKNSKNLIVFFKIFIQTYYNRLKIKGKKFLLLNYFENKTSKKRTITNYNLI